MTSIPLTNELNDLLHKVHSWATSPAPWMSSSDPNPWHYSTVLIQKTAYLSNHTASPTVETGKFTAFPSAEKICNRNSSVCTSVIAGDTRAARASTYALVIPDYARPYTASVHRCKCTRFNSVHLLFFHEVHVTGKKMFPGSSAK
jgi:hypothetical protein